MSDHMGEKHPIRRHEGQEGRQGNSGDPPFEEFTVEQHATDGNESGPGYAHYAIKGFDKTGKKG